MKKTYSMYNIVCVVLCVIIATIMVFPFVNVVYAKANAKINTPNVVLREKPTTESARLTNMYKRDNVEVLEEDGDWYKIIFGTQTGYTKKEFVDLNEGVTVKKASASETVDNNEVSETNEKPEEKNEQVTEPKPDETENKDKKEETIVDASKSGLSEKNITKDIKLKTYPNIFANIVVEAKEGDKVTILSKRGKWTKVLKESDIGWIPNYALEEIE